MSNNGMQKIFIKVESSTEQQENLKNCRKSLKVLQKASTDKENLAGRPSNLSSRLELIKTKTDQSGGGGGCGGETGTECKRKKLIANSTQTDTEDESSRDQVITADDLTSEAEPSEYFWKLLAEKRRVALDDALRENQMLHEKLSILEEELNISRTMLEESKNLVEVLTDMLQEESGNNDSNTEKGECSNNLLLDTSIAVEAKEDDEVKK